jgi:two-component system OmpR family sensor kinase/two-component system sensor histidine kinase BaeS
MRQHKYPPPFPHHRRFPPSHWQHRRRFVFWPFVIVFGGITLLFIIGIGLIIYLVLTQQTELIRGSWVLLLCGIPFVFIFLASIIGNLTFRRFGRPFSDIFSAIDSIAEGDLSVRVPERYPRQFGLLARRFNHMVTELERADQQRRNLTADIAHELRTPLHIIQGNLEGIIDGVYQPNSEHINNTLDETKLLARLVNDLQTLSLAEAGQLPLHPTRFLLADLLNDVSSSFSSQATSLGITLNTNISDSSKEITADYDRLNQVLSNLTSNALHHTPQGGAISLEAGAISSRVQIMVKDTGEGIPAEDIPFIFDRFWRGDRSRTRETSPHSGLGLAIAKQLIHAHGGTIEAQSETGKGTTFIIELPE